MGPGRMAQVGAPLGEVFPLALAAFVAGGAVGGPVATWWSRRHDVEEAEAGDRPPLRPALLEVGGSVRTSSVAWLWSSRPWSKPWREQYTLGEQLPAEDDAAVPVVHLAEEVTVTVPVQGDPDRRRPARVGAEERR